ncbi:MAG TPA: hypothetical protein EYG97_05120 [Arcobacter sp.]|nr:hypothetical protein [Arcobacter sp.]HIP56389.1 hypothetical protein [Arcobacter sp.]
MIEKLHKLKKIQLEQKFMLKQQLVAKQFEIENIIEELNLDLSSAGVEKFGAIGDFKILAIHKNSMKYKKSLYETEKRNILAQIENYNKIIVEFQKEVEKYDYLLKIELKKKIKEEIKLEEMIASEFVLSKYARERRAV